MSKDVAPGRKVLFTFLAGQLRRWHMAGHVIRQQDVAQHSFGVATLISILHPDPSAALLRSALHHDLGELRTGDPSRWMKREHPEMAMLINRAEEEVLLKHGLYGEWYLNEDELNWLHAADLFDAWLFLLQNIVCANEMVRGDFNKATRALRDGHKEGKVPEPVIVAMEQVRAMYAWVKIW